MKIEMHPEFHPRRGGEVKVGNVYAIKNGTGYSVVISKDGSRYKNIIQIRVDPYGKIISAYNDPETYVREHKDLVGFVKDMPTLKIEWLDASNSND